MNSTSLKVKSRVSRADLHSDMLGLVVVHLTPKLDLRRDYERIFEIKLGTVIQQLHDKLLNKIVIYLFYSYEKWNNEALTNTKKERRKN